MLGEAVLSQVIGCWMRTRVPVRQYCEKDKCDPSGRAFQVGFGFCCLSTKILFCKMAGKGQQLRSLLLFVFVFLLFTGSKIRNLWLKTCERLCSAFTICVGRQAVTQMGHLMQTDNVHLYVDGLCLLVYITTSYFFYLSCIKKLETQTNWKQCAFLKAQNSSGDQEAVIWFAVHSGKNYIWRKPVLWSMFFNWVREEVLYFHPLLFEGRQKENKFSEWQMSLLGTCSISQNPRSELG